MSLFGGIVGWLVLCFVAGEIAKKKGRSDLGFFFLALFLTPVIGIIAALVASPNIKNVETAQLASGDSKKCPYCAELIKAEAVACRYCGRDLPPIADAEKPPPPGARAYDDEPPVYEIPPTPKRPHRR